MPDIVFRLRRTSGDGWFWVSLTVGPELSFQFVLNPLFPSSVISESAAQELGAIAGNHVTSMAGGVDVLHDVRIEGRSVPDVTLRRRSMTGRYLGRLRLDGMLGFDYLRNWREVCLDGESLIVTLKAPTGTE